MEEFSKNYTFEEDGFEGDFFGYLVSTKKENLSIFLKKEINNKYHSDAVYDILKDNIENIFVLKNLNIDDEFQGMGYGKMVLEEILDYAYNNGADACILLADSEAGQRESFVLTRFYEENDFEKIYGEDKYPIMLAPSDISFKIKDRVDDFLREDFMKKRNLFRKKM